jgi:DNA-binding HxlR family transcriptional regulator
VSNVSKVNFDEPTNPYHYALHCIGGKWKMTLLHEIYTYGKIRFNQTLKVLPISEKMLSQQLKELIEDGLVQRVVTGDTFPPTIDYVLTIDGARIIPALDIMYIWSIRQMDAKDIPIDADAFAVHKSEKYVDALKDVMEAHSFWPDTERHGTKRGRDKNKD